MRRHNIWVALAFLLSLQACVHIRLDSQLPPIDRMIARSLSDEVVKGLKYKRSDIVYDKMENAFRSATSLSDFEIIFNQLLDRFGVPLNCEYSREEETVKSYPSGEVKRLLKLYYDVETTKYPKGSYYLSIDVVPEGDGLAVTGVYFGRPLFH